MPTDRTIAGCLARIQRGDVSAVGILADYLEEHNLPHAKRVRALWTKVETWNAHWSNPATDMSRSKYTRWQRIAFNRRYLRSQIATLFNRNWQPLPVKKYVGGA